MNFCSGKGGVAYELLFKEKWCSLWASVLVKEVWPFTLYLSITEKKVWPLLLLPGK